MNLDLPSPFALYDGLDDQDEDLYFLIEQSENRIGSPSSGSSGSLYDESSSESDDDSSQSGSSHSDEDISSEEVRRLAVPSPDLPMDIDLPILDDPLSIPALPVREPPLVNYAGSHQKCYVCVILLLAACLHTKHHVTFCAANIMLYTIRLVFKSLNLIDAEEDMPVTLNTVIKRLDLHDRFSVIPVCPQCHRHFPPTITTTSQCPKCQIPLFSTASHTLFQKLLGREPSVPPPKLAVLVAPLSAQLVDFLARPGMENIVEEYRDRTIAPEELNCIMD